MKDLNNPPLASSLIESLRDIGYSFKAAVADIIDNSLFAEARNINILIDTDDLNANIAIIDDGLGMSEIEMTTAMRPGSISPLEERAKNDLGRFGLGLKTASFSQCRKLTLVSKTGSQIAGCMWDLDYVALKNEWLLQILDENEIRNLPYVEQLSDSGTLILWENLDRVIDKTDSANITSALYAKIEEVRKHLQLVFHRYLRGEPGIKSVKISINGDQLKGFDPFNAKHPATQLLQDEKLELDGQLIYIQPYVLPHHSKISRKEYEHYEGDEGYLKNQGFYVYRNARLIIYGTWFRLLPMKELTKLTRIKIDLPNSLDHKWPIGVRKSRAKPPEIIRQRLKKIIERIASSSSKIYTQRGRRLTDQELNTVWIRNAAHNEIFYTINREHPLIAHIVANLEEEKVRELSDVLKMVESQFPVDTFYSDVSGQPEALIKNDFEDEELFKLASFFRNKLREKGVSENDIQKEMQLTEPFANRMEIISLRLIENEE